MKKHIDSIINKTNFRQNCHGLQSIDSAIQIASHYFQIENIPFENWFIREIPLIDDSGKYPVAVVLCINNKILKKEIELDLTRDGKLFSVYPNDEYVQVEFKTILEAINHPMADY